MRLADAALRSIIPPAGVNRPRSPPVSSVPPFCVQPPSYALKLFEPNELIGEPEGP